MALWTAIALAWLILGANSDGVPWFAEDTWLLIDAIVAGTALGVAYRGTSRSMSIYLVTAMTVSTVRSAAYIDAGYGGPAWVWGIVSLTNVALLSHWRDGNG